MDATDSLIATNYRSILKRIESACSRANRSPDDVTLVAVTKYAQMEWVRELVRIGVLDLGESRPQQLVQRSPLLPESVRWHMIGHLQRNKVRPVLGIAGLIHSVDSRRLLERVDALAAELNLKPRVLLEVNVSQESAKHGFLIDELVDAWTSLLDLKNVCIEGLMTMAPHSSDPEDARDVFRGLRELRDRLRDECSASPPLDELSMGMSGDFEVAIEEGATLIRIGSGLFDGMPPHET
jgi:pyridoxal phosphate enzyme (YggS family)